MLLEDVREFSCETTPRFASAPLALLQGFSKAGLPLEINVVCCVRPGIPIPKNLPTNIHYHFLPVPRVGFLRTLHLGCFFSTRCLLHRLQPDLVHAHGTEAWCSIVGAFLPYPNILTVHGYLNGINRIAPLRPWPHWVLQRLLEQISLPKYESVICLSNFMEASLRTKTRHTALIPNAVRQEFYSAPLPHFVPDPKILRIVNIGSVYHLKQQCELVETLIRSPLAQYRVHCFFLGDLDTTTPYGQRFVRLMNLNHSNVTFNHLGNLPVDGLIELLDHSDCLVHVSKTESFCLAVAEALVRSKRVFAFNTGGIPSVCRGFSTATLIPNGKWEELWLAVESWAKVKSLGPTSQDSAKIRFSPKVIAEQHLMSYAKLLSLN
jgi:glycosyltransferase involved in cell wall biosynthesis